MIPLHFDAYELQLEMERMVQQLKIAAPKIVKLEAYLLLKQVVRFTHPNGKAQGRNAVKRDINRAITLLDPAKFTNPKIAQLMRKKDLPALNAIMQRVPAWQGWSVVPFDANLHRHARDSRGRVTSFKKRFTIEKTVWKKYVSAVQGNVGSGKAAWSVGIKETGGGTLPGWIAVHTAEGRYATTVAMLSGDSPKITITTSAKAVVDDVEFRRQLSRAIEVRTNSMRAKTSRMLRDPLKYANLFAQYQ